MGRRKTLKRQLEYQWHGDIHRIIPLQNNYCYITDEKGKLHHLERDSDEYREVFAHVDAATSGKLSEEVRELGW